MKPSREPYGKRACAFTRGFTLTFPSDASGGADRVLQFDRDWCAHFAPQTASPSDMARSRPHAGDYHLTGRKGWR